MVERLGEVGLDGQQLVEGRERLVAALERVERKPVVQERRREIGIRPQCRAEQRQRLAELPLLAPQHAEQMQRFEMIRSRLDQLQIEAFGGGQIALAMELDGLVEHLRRIEHL